MKARAFLALTLAAPALALAGPASAQDDPRVQVVRYASNQPVRLLTSPGNDTTVMLAPGERIATVNISNNALYQVTLSSARDSFVLHTSMIFQQGAPAREASISFSSDVRSYQLLLTPTTSGQAPYVLRFAYDRAQMSRGGKSSVQADGYRLKGNKELRPTSIRDDGSKTYIQWSPDQAIPAVFALDRIGREEMVDGYMRGGTFTIDRVHERLVFRIDDVKAEALRQERKSAR